MRESGEQLALPRKRLLVIDTETGGLSAEKYSLLSLGAVIAYFGTSRPLVSAERGHLFRHGAATCYGRGRVVRRRGPDGARGSAFLG